MSVPNYTVRNAVPAEYEQIGQLMVQVYAQLPNFPKPHEHPVYYNLLANVGELTHKTETELLVAVSAHNQIVGAVVFFGDMQYYGSGGTATTVQNAGGFRLLAVEPAERGQGIGQLLSVACIERAKHKKLQQLIIHSTIAMRNAWKMYEGLGFERWEELDFTQGELKVYGFRLLL